MDRVNVAIVGATGLVGRTMMSVLEQREFPVADLFLFASARSAGSELTFRGRPIPVRELTGEALTQCRAGVALFSAGATVSRKFAPIASASGWLVIDNSSAFRMEPDVPLVVPEVNPEAAIQHRGIIANPNCSTIQLVVALKPLHDVFGIRRIIVSTYQSVTGAGAKGVNQLTAELSGKESSRPAFPHPIAFNCLPQIDEFLEDGSTKEERKMVDETRKILDIPGLPVASTCVRVPATGGHSESVNVEFDRPVNASEARAILQRAPGIAVVDDPTFREYPMPIHTKGRDEVFVGRIRKDPSVQHGLALWIVSDNLRKGAATNAVQIAERIASRPTHARAAGNALTA